jgi:hypothetical protein
MTFRVILTTAVLSLLAYPGADRFFCAPVQQSDPLSDFTQLLQKLAELSPNPCGPPYGREKDWHSGDIESRLFDQAENIITKELNAEPETSGSAQARAAKALEKLEQLSALINAAWPDENRFHFQVLDLPPALVIRTSIRTHGTFFVFGMPEQDRGKPDKRWHMVGSNTDYFVDETPYSRVDLYPLTRGPSGHARFLAKFDRGGCAGSIGVAYDAREWDPDGIGNLEQIIKQAGAFGLDDKVPGFAAIGSLQTKGSMITLPYCWFSPIDTWDNPSLCAVDTYDISGDNVRFQAREYNRPDLVPIAKAIEYARLRDYPAVLGYCTSSQVARKLIRNVTPYKFAEDVRVTHKGKSKEHVELGFDPTYSFDVQKLGDRWRVVAFSLK